ncbi:MAG: translocation/assembly module TamB domain-containing protein [Desulfobacterales bacterium]
MKRRLTRIIIIVPAAAIALAAVLTASLQVFLGTETAGDLIRKHLNDAIPGHVNWEKQDVSIFRGSVRMQDIEILDPAGRQVIALDSLFADIGLTELIRGRILAESVKIRRPGIFLDTGADGGLNIVRAFAAAGKKPESRDEEKTGMPGFNVRVRSLSIQDGRFSFHTLGQGLGPEPHVFISNFSINVKNADLAGRSGKLKVSVQGGRVNTKAADAPIDGFFLETSLAEETLDPLELEFESGNSAAAVSGSVSNVFSRPVPDLTVDASADLSEIRRILGLKQDFSGTVTLNAAARGHLENPMIKAGLDGKNLRLAGTELSGVSLEMSMEDRLIDIRSLETGLGRGMIRTSGTVDLGQAFSDGFASPPTDLQAIKAALELNISELPFSGLPGMGGFRGRLSGRIGVDSTGISPKKIKAGIDTQLQAEGFSPAGSIKPFEIDLSATGGMKQGVVNIENMEAESSDFRLSAEGSHEVFKNRLDLKTSIKVSDPGMLAEKFGITGVLGSSAALEADISGNAARPSVDAVLRADGPGFENTSVDSLDAEIGFSGGRLDLSRVKLESGSSVITFSGSTKLLDAETFRPEPDPDVNITLDTNNMRIRDFVPEPAGRLRVSGSIGGSLKDPSGSFTVKARDIDTKVQKIQAATLEADLSDRKLHLKPLEVTVKDNQSLHARGWVSTDLDYELRLSSDPIDLAAIAPLRDAGLEGRAEISAQGEGRLNDPSFDSLISVSGLAAEGRNLPDTDISAGIENRNAFISIDDPFGVNAVYNLATRDFSASAGLTETELAPFFRIAGLEGFSGSVSASLQADGNAGDIENTSASLAIADLEVLMEQREIASAADFEIFFENREITIPAGRIDLLEDGYIFLRGTGSLDRDIDITAEGVFPAKLAAGFSEEIESPEGSAALDANIGGNINEPDLSAEITLENLGFTLVSTMQQVRSLNGSIRLTDREFKVSDLAGSLDDGKFSVNGNAVLENFSPVSADLDIRANGIPVLVPDMMEMRLNSELKLTGTPDDSLLSGEVMLIEGLYFKDINMNLAQQAGEIGKRRRRTPARTQIRMPDLPFLRNLSLDISVGHRNPFMVDNNLALLAIRPQLSVGGSAENPVITGRAEIPEGTVAYRNTEFEVKKGVVDFIDPYRIEPEVDIRAESEVREWTIRLAITGTPENLDFRLSSNPAEEDADILSLLATGKTTGEMAGSSGGGISPERMLTDLVGGRLEKQLKEGTGLDIVEVEYSNTGSESEAEQEVRVTVGKELSRRLSVKYGVERKSGEMVQQTTGIYRLLENLSANAYQDTAGSFGGEMRYRLEFR